MELNDLRTNEKAENEGVWEDFGGGTKVLIARIGNKRYETRLNALMKPYKRQIRAGSMPDETMDKIIIQVMSETIVLGWEGLTENGKALKYSEAEANRILTDPRYKEFRNLVSDAAQDAAIYRELEVEEEAGN